jgi:lysophospholipase L1-like esterase
MTFVRAWLIPAVLLGLVVSVTPIGGALPAEAADGTILRTITAEDYSCGVGVGIAFDGNDLLISCSSDNVLRRHSPVDGSSTGSLSVTGINGIGAIAWDQARGRLWACDAGTNDVSLINMSTGVATRQFTSQGCFDGLAYDGTDGTLFASADVASTVQHYSSDGSLLESVNVAGTIGGCGSSGLAVGGPYLFLANNGCSEIYRAPKTDPSATELFGSYPARLEDLECDDITFRSSGKAAIWTKDAYDGILNAFELNPGDCGFGGQPPQPNPSEPTKVLALGDSYSAGVGGTGSPDVQDCWRRASDSYSGQLADRAKAAGRDVDYANRACIGATTADILSRGQPGTDQSKQLDYVTRRQPDVITLTIGGNDIGFAPLAEKCVYNSVVFFIRCQLNANRVNLVDKQRHERNSYDGLYDRLVDTYVALRKAQGESGHLYVLSYPTIFEKSALWDTRYLLSPRSGPIGLPQLGDCFGFAGYQARESNELSTRLGDTIYLATHAADEQEDNVHFVDWRNDIITEGKGLFGLKKVRVAYNSEGLCARNAPWDLNGYAFGNGQRFRKDSFHPTIQGYQFASSRLEAELGW